MKEANKAVKTGEVYWMATAEASGIFCRQVKYREQNYKIIIKITI